MKENIIKFLRCATPFLTVIFLWRLSDSFWNPGGILALIPIFFCSFIRPVNWFGIFSILMCLMIDYKMDTLVFWTALYCLFYGINGFQSVIVLKTLDKNAVGPFTIFMGLGIFILMIMNFTWIGFMRCFWVFLWTVLLYIPITEFIKKVSDDR